MGVWGYGGMGVGGWMLCLVDEGVWKHGGMGVGGWEKVDGMGWDGRMGVNEWMGTSVNRSNITYK